MAYNNRYAAAGKSTGLEMTDIPGMRLNPYIKTDNQKEVPKQSSPYRYGGSGKGAEVLSADVIYSNEDKIRKQISYMNKEGVSGPFIGVNNKKIAPESPKIPLGSSSYNMYFSPGKKTGKLPVKLQEPAPIAPMMATSVGLRHLTNGDALVRHSYLNNSMDYGRNKNGGVILAKNVSFDKRNDDFKSNKNLTTNAYRILTKPSDNALSPSVSGSSKYEEVKRHGLGQSYGSPLSGSLQKTKTIDERGYNENLNYNNVPTSPVGKGSIREPAGGFNTARMKRSYGIAPSSEVKYEPPAGAGFSHSFKSSNRIGQNSSVPNFNDPTYHRSKNYNNYGYDVLTGVRKESPNRVL